MLPTMGPDAIEIRPFQPADAEALVACFRRCYGDTYPADAFHDPAALAARPADGPVHSALAVQPGRGVVGHMALTACEPGARVAELGNTVVDPAVRGQNLAGRLTAFLVERCRERGLAGFVHYPTTGHAVMQKLAEKGRGVELGVLLDWVPAETEYVGFEGERSTPGRTAVVAFYHAVASAPARRVHLPARHTEVGRDIYAGAGLERTRIDPGTARPEGASRLHASFEARRGLLRIQVDACGGDLRERVARETSDHPDAPVVVDLPLADPAAPHATRALGSSGFFFGALLPEYAASGDVLRLQRTPAEPVEPRLATAGGKRLYTHSVRDRLATGARSGCVLSHAD